MQNHFTPNSIYRIVNVNCCNHGGRFDKCFASNKTAHCCQSCIRFQWKYQWFTIARSIPEKVFKTYVMLGRMQSAGHIHICVRVENSEYMKKRVIITTKKKLLLQMRKSKKAWWMWGFPTWKEVIFRNELNTSKLCHGQYRSPQACYPLPLSNKRYSTSHLHAKSARKSTQRDKQHWI